MTGIEDNFICESCDEISSNPEPNFYDEEAKEWSFIEYFEHLDSDFEYEGFLCCLLVFYINIFVCLVFY